jgi:hypothetical protein
MPRAHTQPPSRVGPVPVLGLAAMAALAARTWWTGEDALPVSLALVAIAAVLIGGLLWKRPRGWVAAALILLALLAGLAL